MIIPWERLVLPLLTIAAIVAGPVLALYIQRKLDRERASRERKLNIFRTLVSHRATRLSAPFVEALNAIEVEFYSDDGDTRKVIEAWREFCDYLGRPEGNDPMTVNAWTEKSTELLHDLLSEMGEYLGYHFEKGILRRSQYYPKGWGDLESDQVAIRKAVVDVFGGKKPLRVKLEEGTEAVPEYPQTRVLPRAGDS